MNDTCKLIDNPSLKGREDKFVLMELDLSKVVEGWKISLFSFEWLQPEGQVRTPEHLTPVRAEQYEKTKSDYQHGRKMERPVLGLGMVDNVEIGSRKEILLTLYSLGVRKMEVHVPKSCVKDFEKYM